MFRVERPEKKFISKTFRFPASFIEELQSVAKREGVCLNELIYQGMQYALSQMEGEKLENEHERTI